PPIHIPSLILLPPPPTPTLFPYTTLFRSSTQAPISFNGLISGLDTSSVITGLLAIQQAQINAVTRKQTNVQAQQTAYKQLEAQRSEEHTSELQSRFDLVCRLLLEKKKKQD